MVSDEYYSWPWVIFIMSMPWVKLFFLLLTTQIKSNLVYLQLWLISWILPMYSTYDPSMFLLNICKNTFCLNFGGIFICLYAIFWHQLSRERILKCNCYQLWLKFFVSMMNMWKISCSNKIIYILCSCWRGRFIVESLIMKHDCWSLIWSLTLYSAAT